VDRVLRVRIEHSKHYEMINNYIILGFKGNGHYCTDIDECMEYQNINGGCSINPRVACHNTIVSDHDATIKQLLIIVFSIRVLECVESVLQDTKVMVPRVLTKECARSTMVDVILLLRAPLLVSH
jgi:hypothetical protein